MAITDLIFATGLETGDLRVMDLQQGGLITTDVTRHPDSLYSMRAGGTGGMGFFNVASVPATSEIFVSFGVYWNDASLPTADGSQDAAGLALATAVGAVDAGAPIRGKPTQPAASELSLDSVFRGDTARRVSGPLLRQSEVLNFDQFFASAEPSAPAATAPEPGVAPAAPPSDDAEFQSWLQILKGK